MYLDFKIKSFKNIGQLSIKYSLPVLPSIIYKNINNVYIEERKCKYCGTTFTFNKHLEHVNSGNKGLFCSLSCRSKYTQKIRRKKLDKLNSKLVNNQDIKEYISKYHHLCYWGVKEYGLSFEDIEDTFYSRMMDIIRRTKQLNMTNNHKKLYIIKSIKYSIKQLFINKKYNNKEIGFEDLHPSIRAKYIENVEWEK